MPRGETVGNDGSVPAPHSDAAGVPIAGANPAALARYDRAVDALLRFRPELALHAAVAVAEDPRFVMGRVLQAYVGMLGTEGEAAARARRSFAEFRRTLDLEPLPERERRHVDAAATWLAGDYLGAGTKLGDLVRTFPRDVLALAVGHQIDFFTGDAAQLRDRVGGALTAWSPADPQYGFLLGMYAFGLEEAGHWERAREVGLRAVEIDPADVWAVHAVIHTFEMQARFGDGIRFLDARLPDWSAGNVLNVHNWWHYALYTLEAGDTARALAIYDASLHTAGSALLQMEMLDAAALLWRLFLDGSDQTARWRALADAWEPKMGAAHYAFNDMHAVMAYVGADRLSAADRLIADRTAYAAAPRPGITNVAMTRDIGLPVCRSIVSFGRARYDEVVRLLMPIRHRVNEFGGSHAQRDAVQRTLLEAALRANRLDVARQLLSERIELRPGSPYNWLRQARLAEQMGERAAAAAAAVRAAELQV